MKYAVVARPPVFGGKVVSFNADAAMKVPGVEKVVAIEGTPAPAKFQPLGGVAVIARNTWAAIKGREALNPTWDDGPNASYDSAAFKAQIEETARQPGKVVRNDGDAEKALASAAKVVSAEYYIPHLAHATMEPPSAIVRVADGKCEAWTCVQSPGVPARNSPKSSALKEEDVTVHVTLLGRGFAHQLERARVAASQVLDQAHHIAVLLRGFDNNRRDLALSQRDKCFKAPLPTDEVILRLGAAAADSDRLFEAEMSDAGDQLMEDPSVPGSRIEHGDRVDRNHLDVGSGCHSTNLRRVRALISKRRWSVSKR
jgi:CO/xanthine dehydrogenase Mo-binding subunit